MYESFLHNQYRTPDKRLRITGNKTFGRQLKVTNPQFTTKVQTGKAAAATNENQSRS